MKLSIKIENLHIEGTIENGKTTITRRDVGGVEVIDQPERPPQQQGKRKKGQKK